jgi:hypothetical protein
MEAAVWPEPVAGEQAGGRRTSGLIMTIHVRCQCGKQLSAKDEFAGKRVKCPSCGGPLVIPQPQQAAPAHGISDLLDDVGMRAGVTRCPGCGTELSEDAVLCVMCGFDLRLGHRIKTRVGSAVEFEEEDLGDLPVHGVAELDMAERRIARDKLEQKELAKGAPWWMLFIAFLGVVGFGVGMYLAPQDQVVNNSGYVLIVGGTLLSIWYGIKILIEAFRESVLTGILYWLFWPYSLYFIFSRWDRVGGLFIFLFVGNLLAGFGWGLLALAPVFAKMSAERQKNVGMRPWEQRPVAIMVFHDPAQI